MNSEGWVRCKLGDISKSVAYGYTASAQSEPVGPRFLRITDIVNGLNWNTVPFCEITSENYEKYKLEQGDIVIARTGATTGTTEIIKEDNHSVFASYLIRFKIDETIANPYFVGFILKSPSWWDFIKSSIGGSAQPGANAKVLSSYEFLLPPLTIQQQIVEILSALDDKIELNRQTNATLEAIAQAIFKEWFVDFNYPGATGKLVDSELGPIPKGWRVVRLGEITDLSWGDTKTTKSSYVDEGFLAYSASGPDGFLPYHDFSRAGIVVSAIGAYSGKTWFAHGKWSCIKNTIRFWSIDQDISNEYLFLQTSKQGFWPLRGSAQPFISQTDARNKKILYPTDHLANQFGLLTGPFYSKIFHNLMENNILIKIRDSLLPELMDGTFIV